MCIIKIYFQGVEEFALKESRQDTPIRSNIIFNGVDSDKASQRYQYCLI